MAITDAAVRPRSAPPPRSALLRLRNLLSDAAARLALRSPAAERVLVAAGHRWGAVPVFRLFHRRAIATLAAALVRRGDSFRPVSVGGIGLQGDVSHFTFQDLYFKGEVYEPATTAALLEVLDEGDTFVDVGANHGYYSLLAAARVGPRGRVAAFEPNPGVAGALREQVARNGFERVVEVRECALVDHAAGSLPLYLSAFPWNDGLSSLVYNPDAHGGDAGRPPAAVPVPASTFDAWAAERPGGRAALVKIDVEGAEEAVIRGMDRVLRTAPPLRIICETRRGSPAAAALCGYGYAVEPLEMQHSDYGNYLFTHASASGVGTG